MTRTPLQLRKPVLGLTLAAASLIALSACSSGYADTGTGSTSTFQRETGGVSMAIVQIDKDGRVAVVDLNANDFNNHDEDEKLLAKIADGQITEDPDREYLDQPELGKLSEDETTVLWDDGETSPIQINDDTLVLDDDTLQSFDSDASIAMRKDLGYND